MLATASVGESCHRYGQGRCKGKKGVSEMCICGPPRFAHREPPHAPQVAVLVIGRLTLLSFSAVIGFVRQATHRGCHSQTEW